MPAGAAEERDACVAGRVLGPGLGLRLCRDRPGALPGPRPRAVGRGRADVRDAGRKQVSRVPWARARNMWGR